MTASIVFIDPTDSHPTWGATATIASAVVDIRVNDHFVTVPLGSGKVAIIHIQSDSGL